MRSTPTWVFATRPRRLRTYITASVVAALGLPVALTAWHVDRVARGEVLTAVALLALSVLNVELGRLLDGGLKDSHRPHKALSAWALAAALLLPLWWLVPVVVTSYAHARWRGLRLQLWKWVGSGSFVALAGVAAHVVTDLVEGDFGGLESTGPRELVAVVLAAAAFLVTETALFHGVAYLNEADDEVWLRQTLRSRRFYLTEASMLLIGGLSAAVWANSAWLLPLLLPVYALAQQAALHEPLRQAAKTDAKTGLYRYESWRALALAERDRCAGKQRPWSVVFADLDRFKPYNDTYGHLAGDAALAAIADLLTRQLRARDIVGRFGGEEFCLFLPDSGPQEAGEVAERLRTAVESLALPDTGAHVTMSLGVAGTAAGHDIDLAAATRLADDALYAAKERGRNSVHVLATSAVETSPAGPAGPAPDGGHGGGHGSGSRPSAA